MVYSLKIPFACPNAKEGQVKKEASGSYSPRTIFGDRLAKMMDPWGGSSSFSGGSVSRVDWVIGLVSG
jgi:hypothetical protein